MWQKMTQKHSFEQAFSINILAKKKHIKESTPMSNSECPWLFTWPFKFISAADPWSSRSSTRGCARCDALGRRMKENLALNMNRENIASS